MMQALLLDKNILFIIFGILAVLYTITAIIRKIKKARRVILGGGMLMSSVAGQGNTHNAPAIMNGINIQSLLFIICAILFAFALLDIIKKR